MADSGLTGTGIGYATAIIAAGKARNATQKDIETAIMVALDESGMQMLANKNVPESLNYPHDGLGSDLDSIGLFQQRPSQGWGTVAELMDAKTSANKFYDKLEALPMRNGIPSWTLAQKVQKSGDPTGNNYKAKLNQAEIIMSQLYGGTPTIGGVLGNDPMAQLGKIASFFTDAQNWQRIGIFALGLVLLFFAVIKILSATGVISEATKVAGAVIP